MTGIDPDLPVGSVEIAAYLNVGRKTVDQWRQRPTGFPAPRWTVGGRPAWAWGDVEYWWRASGRAVPKPFKIQYFVDPGHRSDEAFLKSMVGMPPMYGSFDGVGDCDGTVVSVERDPKHATRLVVVAELRPRIDTAEAFAAMRKQIARELPKLSIIEGGR